MESNTDFYDMWLKSQKQFVDGWLESIKNMQDAIGGSKDSNPAGGAFNLYNSWLKTVGISFDNMMKNFSSETGRDAFSKLFSGADGYMKLFEFWSPLQKMMQTNVTDPKAYLDLFNPSMYKEVIDKIFGFNNADSMQDFYGHASKLMEAFGGSSQNIIKPWLDAMQKNGAPFMSFASGGDIDAGLKIFQNAYSAFDGTFGKAFKMPTVGKDREKIELILSCFDKYSTYQKNYIEFQHLTYKTSNEASKKLFETITTKIKNGEKIETYGEFFKLWLEENEKTFNVLFKTDEFSKIQSGILDTGLATKRQFQKLIELLLEDYPIALRSEVDDAYKSIHDLKMRVRALEQKG
jgi:class III poly(R)-hydroxyalkanoic acid synthase PhaE subunit